MTETMSNEAYNSHEFDLAAEIQAIASDILTIVPEATESKKFSTVESRISDDIKIVLAHRKNDDPFQSDFIVSQVKSIPGQPLQRETFRWSSAFPESRDLQVYETVLPDKETSKPAPISRKGFRQDDLERLRELVITAGEHERSNG